MAIIKNIAVMRRKAGTTREEFRKYYEEKHVPLAMSLIGQYLIDYRRNYNDDEKVAGDYGNFSEIPKVKENSYQGFGEFDAISEYWYDSETMPEVAKIVEDNKDIIVADEANFMDRSSLRIFSVTEGLTDMERWR